MPSFFGYNYFQWNSEIRDHTVRLDPTNALFLDNDGGANELAGLLPGCKVVAREVSDIYEKNLHRNRGEALKYVQRRAQHVRPEVYINIGCEPPIDSIQDLELLVDEYMKALEWAQPRGLRVAAPHSAHYGWVREHWVALAPLAGFMGRYPDQFLLTGDEYFAGVPFSGVQDTRLPEGNEKGHIRPETWLPSNTGVYYHIGRLPHNLFPILQELGLPIPLTLMTEGGADDLQDVEVWRKGLKKTPPFDIIKGYKTLENQWNEWGAPYGWDFRTYYLKGLEAIRDVIYKPWPQVIGYSLFVLGNNGDPLWLGMDHWDSEMMRLLETTNKKGGPVTSYPTKPKPANPGNPTRRKVRTNATINVRSAPTTSGRPEAASKNGDLVNVYFATAEGGGQFKWHWVEGPGYKGWQALVYEFEEEQYIEPERPTMTFSNPAQYPHVILEGGRFNAPRNYSFNPGKLQKHEGLDFSSLHAAPKPRIVVAPADGIVQKVKTDTYYGNYVRIYHGKGFRAYYAHLERALVNEGDLVRKGDPIGWEGATGNVSGPHLHWTLSVIGYGLPNYVVDDVIDPQPLLVEEDPQPGPIDSELRAAILFQAQRINALIAGLAETRTQLEAAANTFGIAMDTLAQISESLEGMIGEE